MNFDETIALFFEKYPQHNPEHHPRQSMYAFVTWFNGFRHTDQFKGIMLELEDESKDK